MCPIAQILFIWQLPLGIAWVPTNLRLKCQSLNIIPIFVASCSSDVDIVSSNWSWQACEDQAVLYAARSSINRARTLQVRVLAVPRAHEVDRVPGWRRSALATHWSIVCQYWGLPNLWRGCAAHHHHDHHHHDPRSQDQHKREHRPRRLCLSQVQHGAGEHDFVPCYDRRFGWAYSTGMLHRLVSIFSKFVIIKLLQFYFNF